MKSNKAESGEKNQRSFILFFVFSFYLNFAFFKLFDRKTLLLLVRFFCWKTRWFLLDLFQVEDDILGEIGAGDAEPARTQAQVSRRTATAHLVKGTISYIRSLEVNTEEKNRATVNCHYVVHCCRTVTIFYDSSTGTYFWQVTVLVPAPYLDHKKQF